MGVHPGTSDPLGSTMIVNLYATTIVIALCAKMRRYETFLQTVPDNLIIYQFTLNICVEAVHNLFHKDSTSLSHFSIIIIIIILLFPFSFIDIIVILFFSFKDLSPPNQAPLLSCQCNHSPRHKFAAMRASVETSYRRNPCWLTLLRKSWGTRAASPAHRRTSRACCYNNTFVRACSRAHCCGVNVGAQYESSSIETIGNFRRRISVGSGGSAHGHSLGKLKSRQ